MVARVILYSMLDKIVVIGKLVTICALYVYIKSKIKFPCIPRGMDRSSEINLKFERNFNDEAQRLISLGSWTNHEVDKEKLARAGFFYKFDLEEYVKCYFCNVTIGSWMRGDNPFIEHNVHSPTCPFLNGEPTNNLPIAETKHLLLEELALLKKSKSTRRNAQIVRLEVANIIETARHPGYADKKDRLRSFINWPAAMNQTPEEMSDAGFFYLGIDDEVKCFYCGGCLRNFTRDDLALKEHKKYYSNRCLFILYIYKNLKVDTNKWEHQPPIKPTPEQIQFLIEFMEHNENVTGAWKDVTKTLNDFDGATIDIKGWKDVWRNHKCNSNRVPRHIDEIEKNSLSSSKTIRNIQVQEIENPENSIKPSSLIEELDLMQLNTDFPEAKQESAEF